MIKKSRTLKMARKTDIGVHHSFFPFIYEQTGYINGDTGNKKLFFESFLVFYRVC